MFKMGEETYATLGEVGISVGRRGGTITRTSCFFSSELCKACVRALWTLKNSHESDEITFEHYSCMTKECEHATALNLEVDYSD